MPEDEDAETQRPVQRIAEVTQAGTYGRALGQALIEQLEAKGVIHTDDVETWAREAGREMVKGA